MSAAEAHICSTECSSVHRHIIRKLLLTLRASRPDVLATRGERSEESAKMIRHISEVEAEVTVEPTLSRKLLNKWFHLGIYENEQMKQELVDLTLKWSEPYVIEYWLDLKAAKESQLHVRNLIDNGTFTLDSLNLPDRLLIERWNIEFAPNEGGKEPELAEIYKRIIVLVRTVYSSMRQMPAHCLVKELSKPYQARSFATRLSISTNYATSEFTPLPGTEAYEQSVNLPFSPIVTAHGTLKVGVEYRHNFEIVPELGVEESSVASLKESFEEIAKPKIISRSPSIVSSSPGKSPRTKQLGMGVPAQTARRSASQGQVSSPITSFARTSSGLPQYLFASPQQSPAMERTRTSSVLASEAMSPPSTTRDSSFMMGPMSPSVLGDSAITQFMKQCENRPALESLKPSAKDALSLELGLTRRIDELRESLQTDLGPWLADFKAVESLSAVSPSRARPTSADASIMVSGKLPAVSPVIECATPSPSESDNTSRAEEYHLMFPL